MNKKDLLAVTIIGAAVGLLAQPIVRNLVLEPSLALQVGLFVGFLILAPLALFVAFLIGTKIPVLYQFAKFAAVGSLNSAVDVGVYNLVVFLTASGSQGITFTAFKAISFIAATTNSFFWNKFWTFSSKGPVNAKETTKFYAVAVVGWIVNVSSASFVVNVLDRPTGFSPNLWANVGVLVGVFAALLWDFVGYKYFVFTKPKEPSVVAEDEIHR